MRQELNTAVRQVEAHANLLARIQGLPALPPMRGWPISPDLGSQGLGVRSQYCSVK